MGTGLQRAAAAAAITNLEAGDDRVLAAMTDSATGYTSTQSVGHIANIGTDAARKVLQRLTRLKLVEKVELPKGKGWRRTSVGNLALDMLKKANATPAAEADTEAPAPGPR